MAKTSWELTGSISSSLNFLHRMIATSPEMFVDLWLVGIEATPIRRTLETFRDPNYRREVRKITFISGGPFYNGPLVEMLLIREGEFEGRRFVQGYPWNVHACRCRRLHYVKMATEEEVTSKSEQVKQDPELEYLGNTFPNREVHFLGKWEEVAMPSWVRDMPTVPWEDELLAP